MEISIREGTSADILRVFTLLKEFAAFQKTPEKITITAKEMVEAEDLFRCLIAETKNGEIAGFASYFFAFYSWSGKAIYLDDLYVQPTFRGHKMGSRLLKSIITLATNSGCYKVRWQVSRWNQGAVTFYRKLGAEVDDIELNCDYLILKK